MTLSTIADIADLPLDEALRLVDGRFDTEAILQRPIGYRGLEEYYRQSDRGYRLFHSREGALHIALGGDGHRDTGCYSRQAEIFRDHLDATGARRAIELGCGMGYNVRWLAENCPDRSFVGVDLTEQHIRHAQKQSERLANAEYIVGNYEQLPHDGGSFDGALAVETLCQTPNLEAALGEAHRVLRPGGRLVVVDCFRTRPIEQLDANLARAARLVERATATHAFSVVDDWVATAESAGLRLVEAHDLSAETEQNLARLYSLARRFFKMPLAAQALSRALPPLLLENSVCGLLMPFTVGGGAHTYQSVVVEKEK